MRLKDYLQLKRESCASFGRKLGVSRDCIAKACRGRVPSPELVVAIYVETLGVVPPTDLYTLPDLAGLAELEDKAA